MFKKNVFGQFIFVKRLVIRVVGLIIYLRFNIRHKSKISGAEIFSQLPDKNVLIVSNHQTYFMDVSFFMCAIHSALQGRPNHITFPGHIICRKHNIYYVAAEETMKAGFIPKLLALSGAVTIKRTWRANGQNVRRKVDRKDTENIDKAMEDGWVITFPQGTTTPFAPGRKGTAFIVKNHKPVVVPVVIDGFRRAFDKKGMFVKKRSVLNMTVKKPLDINYDNTIEEIMDQIMDSIEQSPKFDQIEKIKKQDQNLSDPAENKA